MIGVVCEDRQRAAAAELFELFKTPWRLLQPGEKVDVLIVSSGHAPSCDARLTILYGVTNDEDVRRGLTPIPNGAGTVEIDGLTIPLYTPTVRFVSSAEPETTARVVATPAPERPGTVLIRCGFDLFEEVNHLLSVGQPAEAAHIPTLDLHIEALRRWILAAGVAFAEIPPVPFGRELIVCLTHDIDFLDLRRHGLDRTAVGFLYRATIGSVLDVLARRSNWRRLLTNWRAAALFPFVHLGLAADPWAPFAQYAELEAGLRSTFFVIPFKGRVGQRVPSDRAELRAVKYDVDDARIDVTRLAAQGFEIAVHGIDAWSDPDLGRAELDRISAVTGSAKVGVRMHWLLFDRNSPERLEAAGFAYDSTVGYNDTVGFRAGTAQVFRPLGTSRILELPLHIQDTALFFPRRLRLREEDAWSRCQAVIRGVETSGGVLTVLWHERSLAPERLWASFYRRLLAGLRSRRAWFTTASEATGWFDDRRAAVFIETTAKSGTTRVGVSATNCRSAEALSLRVHIPRPDGTSQQVNRSIPRTELLEIELEAGTGA